MSTHQSRLTGTNSLIAVAAMTVVTSIHHVYRLGLEVLVPALVLIALPVLLLRWQRRSGRRIALWAYAGLNLLTFSWFAFVDGFLDHVIKALGLQNTTFLPGGDAETVPTVFHLWSPQAGDLFYEGTGILTFALGLVAIGLTAAFVRTSLSSNTDRELDDAATRRDLTGLAG
jgi:hypothetical protein